MESMTCWSSARFSGEISGNPDAFHQLVGSDHTSCLDREHASHRSLFGPTQMGKSGLGDDLERAQNPDV